MGSWGWKEVKFLVRKPGDKGWSCCSHFWLKGGRGINPNCVCRESVNTGFGKRESRQTISQKRSRGGGQFGSG